MYQKLTEKIAGKPEEQILSYLMLRSLKSGAVLGRQMKDTLLWQPLPIRTSLRRSGGIRI